MSTLAATPFSYDAHTLLLFGGGVALYAASRSAVDALVRDDDPRPGRLAVGHALPVVACAAAAAARGRGEIVLGVVFATSIACLSLVLGIALTGGRIDGGGGGGGAGRRAWPFALPVAVLTFLVGLGAELSATGAVVLAVAGLAVAGVWGGAPGDPAAAPHLPAPRPRFVQLALAVGLAVAGGYAAVAGTVATGDTTRGVPAGYVAATMLATLIALPMVGTASLLGRTGKGESLVSMAVGVVQINLCVALPMAVGVWYAARAGWLPDLPAAIPFPLGVWRVDTVLLIVLSLPLVPTAMNRWTLGRAEGVGLILMYGVYLVLVTLGSWR